MDCISGWDGGDQRHARGHALDIDELPVRSDVFLCCGRPLHVSLGPENTGAIYEMTKSATRQVPRLVKSRETLGLGVTLSETPNLVLRENGEVRSPRPMGS